MRNATLPLKHRRTDPPQGGERSRVYHWLVRAGFVSRGITYGVIGGLTMALALGAGTAGAAPNQQGALALIARDGLGRVVIVGIAAGLLAYAMWKFDQGIHGGGPQGGSSGAAKDRVSNFAGGAAYLVFFAVAVKTLAGSGGNASGAPRHAAAGVLAWPGGPFLVGLGGLALILISAFQAYEASRCRFAQDFRTADMTQAQHHAFLRLGQVGLIARAAVFALVGYFLLRTAIGYNARDAVGLDGALERLHHQSYGPWLTGLAAAGLLTFAVFSLVEARFRRL
ncbi:MAG TPA: DUF1206 domain-containing protein [Solirubrobacteraceae bacterium]